MTIELARSTKQNLPEWRKHGVRERQMRQAALKFNQDLDAEERQAQGVAGWFPHRSPTNWLGWIALRYAAAGHAELDPAILI